MKIKQQIIDSIIVKKKQGWSLSEILWLIKSKEELHGVKKVRIYIERDSYDRQCKCYIDLWDGTKWNLVYNLPHQEMETNKLEAYAPKAIPADFAKDRQRLIDNAIKIIF